LKINLIGVIFQKYFPINKYITMLDSQTTKLLIGVLFLFIAYTMFSNGKEEHVTYAFAGLGGLVLMGWFKSRDGGGRSGCL
jgi:hypothetical protein